MKAIASELAVLALLCSPALADAWKDESGKGRWGKHRGDYHARYDREYKEEF